MFIPDLSLSLAWKGHERLPAEAGEGRDRVQAGMNMRGQAGPGGEKISVGHKNASGTVG
jgi:hypothetical protein